MADEKDVRRVHVRLGGRESYEIEIGAGLLSGVGVVARKALSPHARRVALISNRRVFELYGETCVRSLRAAGFKVSHWLMGEGERYKSLRTAESALRFLAEAGLERSDAVMALGGGVVGDLAGFAAALYLRGVAFLQAPTTLLAQIDSSVGGKTGVNTRTGKNLVGTFHQPRAVLVDTETLRTLPARELTAGWCEAIKQGAVGDRRLFERTKKFLAGVQPDAAERKDESAAVERIAREARLAGLIAAQCSFKAKIVAGDERESVGRTDSRSRRILNFGHTVAHALESVTGYRRFRHGEAVGYGMLAAAEISFRLGLLEAAGLESLREAVRLAGRLPRADDLDTELIRRALRADKKSVGGEIQWVLLEELGRARIVGGRDIPVRVVNESVNGALRLRRGDS
ncbi:MAG: 3-dehydroquinate synthase [Acidobacteria bacterium]|nr:3-dehydroquinate synthase [Acidobacteriota bacterium]